MEILLWALAINWGLPLAGYTIYALLLWLVLKDYVCEGFMFPVIKLRLVNEGKEEAEIGDRLEPWHVKLWKDWGGHGGMGWIFYRDEAGAGDDWWVDKTVTHEGAHGLQWLIFGLMMFVLMVLHMLFIWIFQRDKHPYLDNWAERWARKKAGQKLDYRRDEWPNGPYDRWPWFSNPSPEQVRADRKKWRAENGITA